MKKYSTSLRGLILIEPRRYYDQRGQFGVLWHGEEHGFLGIPNDFVQDNVSHSRQGVLRGLHFQNPFPQGKLLSVLIGSVFDVAVDLRRDSPTFGKWESFELSGENGLQLYVPPGFAHGFLVTGSEALVLYKCTRNYSPGSEHTLLWNDPSLAIPWPVEEPLISEKDLRGIALKDFSPDALFTMEGGS